MITGIVNVAMAATVPLSVYDGSGRTHTIEAVIDTGYGGFLTLSPTRIASLGLSWIAQQQGSLANGSSQTFDVYAVTLLWDGAARQVRVVSTDAPPLIGMGLLQDYELRIQARVGGLVTIEALP